MDYKEFYTNTISQLLSGFLSRQDAAKRVANELPIDINYDNDRELLENCEWALRHANESDYYTTEKEFEYYLSCLKGGVQFSVADRDSHMQSKQQPKN